ncbi:helix-turn-helix domain-containing protein [Paenibacillus hubeiensis]|uniref:helix-turn-helix domain-containing protein n=1 Tax=Paenibacillus hubeiensis TaxID=3077330 RepID=UPI0031BA99B4
MSDEKKRTGDDFKDFMKAVCDIPEVREYLHSFSAQIANLVYARRLQLGYTQTKLAELANTTQARISSIEAGKSVSTETLDAVFQVLGLIDLNPRFGNEEAAALSTT